MSKYRQCHSYPVLPASVHSPRSFDGDRLLLRTIRAKTVSGCWCSVLTGFAHDGGVLTYYFRYPLLRLVMVQGEAGAVLGVTAMESRDIRASTAGPGSCTTPPPPSTALTSAIHQQPPVSKQHRCRHCNARYWHRKNILKSVKIFDISCGWRRCAENPRNVRGGGAAAAAVAASLCNRFTLHHSHWHQDTFTPSAATTALASTPHSVK